MTHVEDYTAVTTVPKLGTSREARETPPRPTRATARGYLIPITIESGPTRCSTRVEEKPASVIQLEQSAPV